MYNIKIGIKNRFILFIVNNCFELSTENLYLKPELKLFILPQLRFILLFIKFKIFKIAV